MPEVNGAGQNQVKLIEVSKPGSNSQIKYMTIKVAEELLQGGEKKPESRAKFLLRQMPDHLFLISEGEIAKVKFGDQEAKLFSDGNGVRIIVPWHMELPHEKQTNN